MALVELRQPCGCGANVWRVNQVDREPGVRVASHACVYCGRVRHYVQAGGGGRCA